MTRKIVTQPCPWCRYRVALRVSGVFIKHYAGPDSGERCEGSGQKP